MATEFSSAAQRRFWLAMVVNVVSDAFIALLVALLFVETAGEAVAVGLMIMAGAYAFLAIYGLISLGRGAAMFFLFERRARIAATVDRMIDAKMPRPDRFYSDPADYLLQVASSDHSSKEAKLFSGVSLGSLEALRNTGRPFLTMTLLMVLESAIEQYGRRFGFENLRDE